MSRSTPSARYHAVFAGFGAASCILLHELHHSGWLRGKQIAIIEPSEKKTNDRTFCFWAAPDSELVQRFSPVISHSWDKVAFNGTVASISPLYYHHIRGIDLYDYTRDLLNDHQVDWYHESVLETQSIIHGALIRCSEKTLVADVCFDSRTKEVSKLNFPEVALHQSFLGYKVKLRHAAPDAGYATLMDFDFEQNGFTQFIYRLPYEPDYMLVELTRFGEEKIDPGIAAPKLEDYIRTQYGEYEILEKEYGCIPMIYSEQKYEDEPCIISLGTRAGKVKPSTGYAFRNMFDHACEISAALNQGKTVLNNQTSMRFHFYDHLLLIILQKWPQEGRRIFNQLLSSVPAKRVLTFLNEQTSIGEEISIFSKLPVPLFLKALMMKEWSTQVKHRTEWMVAAGTLVAAGIGSFFPDIRDVLVWPILIIGLIMIGIPHGAVDDMLEKNGMTRRIDLRFISLYLFQSAVMIGWWWIHPPTALIAFLGYSAWHFGQADVIESDIESKTLLSQANLLFHGAGTLGIILLSHIPELNPILTQLRVPVISVNWQSISFFLLGLLVLQSILLRSRKLFIGYLTLAISSQLPLLMAFGIYFIFQHSLRGWKHLRTRLQKTNFELYQSALPFHLGAWLMLGLMYWLLRSTPTGDTGFGLVGIFFIFLSSLSFPHVLAMHKFYTKDL